MNDDNDFYSTDERIQAVFAAVHTHFLGDTKEGDRAISDAIDAAMSHAYAEGRADERKEWQEQAMEKACRAMNETGQGEHMVSVPVTDAEADRRLAHRNSIDKEAA